MLRSFLRQSLVALAACALFLPIAVYYGAPAQAGSITISDSSCTVPTVTGPDGQGNITITCGGGGGGGPGVPSGCSIAPGSNSVAANTALTFTVTCSATNPPTAWAWSGTGTAGCVNTSNSCGPITFATTGTVTVTPSNAAGNGNTVSSTQTVGGGGGGPIACAGYSNTRVIDFGSLAAGASGQKYTQQVGGLGANDALVIRFTASPSLTTQSALGSLGGAEYGDQPAPRYGALSNSSCDFTGGIPYSCTTRRGGTATYYSIMTPGSQTVSTTYSVVAANCQPQLTPGQTYYLNLTTINPATGANGCVTASCNMIVNIQAPNGTP